MKEFRLFGPPGTGKTWDLATRTIPKAVEMVGEEAVFVTSFTRAAAREIAGRSLPIPDYSVGTLHSACYRMMGMPEMVGGHIDQWNKENPHYLMGGGEEERDVDEGPAEGNDNNAPTKADILLNKVNMYRNKMVPESEWGEDKVKLNQEWKLWKHKHGYIDFTDMIEGGFKYKGPNEKARIVIVDEAQDLTPLQLALVRQWGQNMEWFILAGDPDQCIYQFTGATPKAFIEPDIPQNYTRVLHQSYRVPKEVHGCAMDYISRNLTRVKLKYQPRPARGAVTRVPAANYNVPEMLLPAINGYIKSNQSVMILTSCSYMLGKYQAVLRREGIPFHNPYRRKRGDWNPLARKKDKITTVGIVESFMSRGPDDDYWTIEQLLGWAPHIRTGAGGLIPKTAKKAFDALNKILERGAPGLQTSRGVLAQILEQSAHDLALSRDQEWFAKILKSDRAKTASYPLAVARKWGAGALGLTPKVIIGTIHSVKGGEADVVILHPDISLANWKISCANHEGKEANRRMFYVGMTRARNELIITGPGSTYSEKEVWR